MDVTALRDRIQSTLDPNADNRRQAEIDLKYVCGILLDGFDSGLYSYYFPEYRRPRHSPAL